MIFVTNERTYFQQTTSAPPILPAGKAPLRCRTGSKTSGHLRSLQAERPPGTFVQSYSTPLRRGNCTTTFWAILTPALLQRKLHLSSEPDTIHTLDHIAFCVPYRRQFWSLVTTESQLSADSTGQGSVSDLIPNIDVLRRRRQSQTRQQSS